MLKEWSPASKLGLKVLTLKTSMLVALASAKRPSSLSLLSLRSGFCEVGESSIRFQPTDLEKTEGMGHCAPPLLLSQYTEDPRLCPVYYLKAYIRETRPVRSSDKLFVSLVAPHGSVMTSTIAAWLKKVIVMSGQAGSGGSTRSASSSQAVMKGASLQTVLAAGDWARSSTFKRFYYKPTELTFQEIVLNK